MRASCSRVTHPCAGRRQQLLLTVTLPLDLHVLSLPLAFILSQDQTLHCISHIILSSSWQLNPQKRINASRFILFGTCFLYFISLFNQLFSIPFFKWGCKGKHYFWTSKFLFNFLKFFFRNRLLKQLSWHLPHPFLNWDCKDTPFFLSCKLFLKNFIILNQIFDLSPGNIFDECLWKFSMYLYI